MTILTTPSSKEATGSLKLLRASFLIFTMSALLFAVSFVCTTRAITAEKDKTETSSQGLSGVLLEEVPEELIAFDFESLGPNWESWSEELQETLVELYETESLSLKRQDELLTLLEQKIETIEVSISDYDYHMIHKSLKELNGRLSRRVQLARLSYNILTTDHTVALKEKLQSLQPVLNAQLNSIESYLLNIKNGSAWIDHLKLNAIKKGLVSKIDYKSLSALLQQASEKISPYSVDGDDQVAFVSRPQIANFRNAVVDYNKSLVAANKKANRAPQRKQISEFLKKLESFEEFKGEDASAYIRSATSQLDKLDPQSATALTEFVLKNYLNYNFRAFASENFLREVLAQEPKQESGAVRDCILGARVYGNQCTIAETAFDLTPNNNGISFNIGVTGHTHMKTYGVTDQATVWTTGNHNFYASKSVHFDGTQFSTDPASMHVTARNSITGARIHHRGLLTWMLHLDDFALSKAREKQGQTEAIARRKIREKSLPKFNSEVDAEFLTRGDDLERKLFQPLRDLNLYPDVMAFRSTDTDIRISSRLLDDGELAANKPNAIPYNSNSAYAQIHESWMNNAVARMSLGGRTMTQQELMDELRQRLEQLLGRKIEPKKKEDKPSTDQFVFHKKDPIRFRVSNGQLILIIKAGLIRQKQVDPPKAEKVIPTQKITIPINIELKDGKVLVSLEGDDVIVEPMEGGLNIVNSRIIGKKIKDAFPSKELKTDFVFKGEKRDVNLVLNLLEVTNGWITLSVQPAPPVQEIVVDGQITEGQITEGEIIVPELFNSQQ